MAKSSKVDALMSIIAQTPSTATPTPEPPEKSPKTALDAKKPKATRETSLSSWVSATGKFSSIHLNPEDQRILREFSIWFAGQGKKINDTLIIRAALRAAKTGRDFLEAYDKAALSDRRFKKTKV